MLQQLEIYNIALIDEVTIEFGEGLNILTGETGAGKSIIIDSINAILGERVSRDIIRTGQEKALIEAVFCIPSEKLSDIFESIGIQPEEDGTLIITREISLSGRNICRINGIMSTASILKEIGSRIIDMHGQYDNQSLLRDETHLELLDSFGGSNVEKLRMEYSKLLEQYKDIKNTLKSLAGNEGEQERKIDLLKFQIEDITKANLVIGEEEKLLKQRVLLANSEKIINSLNSVYNMLYSDGSMVASMKNSAYECIGEAISELNSISKYDSKYQNFLDRLENLSFILYDLVDEVRNERDNIEYHPSLLEEVESRIDTIYKLKRKYGNSIEDILLFQKKAEQELEVINNSQQLIDQLTLQLEEVREQLYHLASKINSERSKAAELLQSKIDNELWDLEMKKAQFKVNIEFDDSIEENGDRNFMQTGLDRVEFLISANVGEPLKPLSKIASGGEMSRIMLAIKAILADVDQIPTLIFDEIDSGISGVASQKVSEKLSLVSKNHQVICVTHLPQIACMADYHFLIKKINKNDKTVTRVKKLEEKEVIEEISRIISGSYISDITRKHAEELLNEAKNKKR
jgi:DNA repair protein RecN (Recombination protein N)